MRSRDLLMSFAVHYHERYPSLDDWCTADRVERTRFAKSVVTSCRTLAKHTAAALDGSEPSCGAGPGASTARDVSVARSTVSTVSIHSGIPLLRNRGTRGFTIKHSAIPATKASQ